ncbi:hypothetical protein E1295_04085 [Nonomuraea mesophila]|uniref:DUF4404 family protein n=1 Tax=Nonomuraea mesophila TaxID=2530382 RepID=A0A4R5FW97_9ACTN|nr:hypothetical protein [Nonomuraea mesophila]TDE59089.1 hypothetical protein E1295_04085 [Nonomuraea mesophila]
MGDEYGIHVSGGQVSGPIAMGSHARAVVVNGGEPAGGQAQELLERLDRLLAAHEADLAEPARARRDAGDVRQELAEAEPDRSRILDALSRLSTRAAQVTPIVEVITQLRALFP